MKVISEGIKGRDLVVDLPKLSLCVAGNGAGKSTIADTIRLALLGRTPINGKAPEKTAILLRGRSLKATVVLNDGRVASFGLSTNGKGGYTTETSCSWLTETGDVAREQIRNLVGREEKDADEVLDCRTLLNESPDKRAQRIQALVASSARTSQELFRAVSRYTVQRLAGVPDDRMPAKIQELRPIIEPGQWAILIATADEQKAKLAESIAVAVAWANEQKRAADNLLKDERAAKKQLEQRLQGLPETNPTRLAELEAERDEINRQIGAVAERIAAAEARAATITEARESLTRAEENLRNATTAWEAVMNRRPELENKRRLLAGVVKALDDLPAPPAPPAIATAQELVVQRGKLQSIQQEIEAILVPVAETTNDVIADLQRQLADVDAASAAIQVPEVDEELLGRIDEIETDLAVLRGRRDEADRSPLRQMVADLATFKAEWRALKGRTPGANDLVAKFCDAQHAKLVGAMGEDASASLSAQIDEKDKALEAARAELATQTGAGEAALATWAEHESKAVVLRGQIHLEQERHGNRQIEAMRAYTEKTQEKRATRALIEQQITELEDAEAAEHDRIAAEHAEQRGKHDVERRGLTKKRDEFQNLIAELTAADAAGEKAFNDARDAYTSAEQHYEDVGGGEQTEDAAETSDGLATRLDAVVAEIAQLQGAASTSAQLTAILADIARDEARSVVFKALEEACKRVRDEEIDASGGPIAGLMDQMLAAAGRKEKAIVGSDMVGWMAPDVDEPAVMRQVDVKALSNGQYQYYLALLTAADMILRGAELKPLLVEAGEMDEALLQATCASIRAVEDRITMCLIMRWAEVETPEGWQRVTLDGARKERAEAA